MRMNVSFQVGEVFDGWKIVNLNGLNDYVARKDNISLCFSSEAGTGRNYFKVKWYRDDNTGRVYQAQRYLYKYIPVVRELSYELLKKYRTRNGMEVDLK